MEHQRRLAKTVNNGAAAKMKRAYDAAQTSLTGKLRKLVGTGKKDTFTAHQQRIVLAQVRQGQAQISARLAGNMGPLSRTAQETALNGLTSTVSRLSRAYSGSEIILPVEEAGVFAGVIDQSRSSLLKIHQTSFARYGANLTQQVEQKLAVSLLSGETPLDAIDGIEDTLQNEWWQGERIVRTEMSYAYNVTHRDGIAESAEEIPELMQRWEEHCDEDGQPLDDRVAVDSIAMHGQVTEPEGLFYMPATAPYPDAKGKTAVPERLVGMSWEFPPNRPNDRSVLSPWMADWGIPGWRYVGGARVPISTEE